MATDGSVAMAERTDRLPRDRAGDWLNSAGGLATLFALGLVIRLGVAPLVGFHVDLSLFRSWATRLAEVGPGEFYDPELFADYPPGYLYVLWVLGTLSSSPGYVLLKLPAIAGDAALAWTAATLAARLHPAPVGGFPVRVVVVVAVLFNPAVIALSAGWGQVDVIPAVFIVGTLVLLLTGARSPRRDVLALASFAIAVAMKPQSGFVFPVIAYALYRRYLHHRRGDALVRGLVHVGVIGTVSLAVWSASGPAFGLSPVALVRFYASSSSVYEVTSAWAFNLWGAIGFYRDDSSGPLLTSVAGIPALYVGTLCYLVGTAFVLWRVHRAIDRGTSAAHALCAASAGVSMLAFAVLTRMHERYLFTSLALLAPLVGWQIFRRGYVALSTLFVLNLWYPFAYFNAQSDASTLRIEPVFGWLYGPLFSTDTWQKKVLSVAVVVTSLGVTLRGMARIRGLRSASADPDSVAVAADEPRGNVHAAWTRWAPTLAVAAVCLFNLIILRGETSFAPSPNDSALHLQMVRWAGHQLDAGRLALDGWFPFLSLGSSHFHHYQSLPHTITAVLARVLSADETTTYLWTQYLLLASWPISIFGGARLLGWSRWVAAAAAVIAPVVVSAPGYGIEHMSYTWQGYGVYSQLWGMWLLPLALGWSWRAITTGAGYARAVAALALTIAMHFLTAYLALVLVAVWGLTSWRDLRRRVVRTAAVLAASLAAASWVLVPLLADRAWSAQSEFYDGTTFSDSFGARRVLGWLVSGELFDRGRFPAVTLLAAAGVAVSARHARHSEGARAVLGAAVVSLVLFFGRPTLGPLTELLPGNDDLQIHRFIIGVHLAGLVLAGIGLVGVATAVSRGMTRLAPAHRLAPQVATVVVIGVVLLPALQSQAAYDARGAAFIREQRTAERGDGADLRQLVHLIRQRGDGRAYAGLRSNWGESYRVGHVPVFAELADADVDAIGFTFRTVSSLSSDPEALFDETNPAHYEIFNVRYVLLPQGREPSVRATLVDRRGRHRLFEVETSGYFQVVDRIGSIQADRTNLGSASRDFLSSNLAAEDAYLGVAFDGRVPEPATVVGTRPDTSPGRVESELSSPIDGRFAATVEVRRTAVLLLKVSFDPRWRVTVDGETAEAVMLSPSLIGVDLAAGRHTVAFRYEPYSSYGALLTLGAVIIGACALLPRWLRRRRRDPGD